MQKLKLLAIILIGGQFIIGCTKSHQGEVGSTTSLTGLKKMAYSRASSLDASHKNKIRYQAVEETALTIGAQSGLAAQAKTIDSELSRQARILDTIYNFNALILNNNVLPPVLQEGRNTLNLANSQAIRISDRTYRILKQARFVTTAPNWRQYLWLDYHLPERPHQSVLPKNATEREIWDEYVTKGWHNGIQQAQAIFADNIARLKQEYLGIILYRKLLAQNMVSPPFVTHTELGVTGDENQINIDDAVLRITALPALNPDSKSWRAAVSKDKDKLQNLRKLEKLASKNQILITDKAWQPTIPNVG